jgi:hypothetical protein
MTEATMPVSSGTKQNRARLLLLISILLPLVYYLLVTWIFPRPYHIQPADIEQDYYYNAKLIAAGYPPFSIAHPGTPVQELGALILRLTGGDIAHSQAFFNVGYLVVALANAIALAVFSRWVLKGVPLGWSLLAVFVIAASPAWLAYGHTFGADSFLIPVGLCLLTCFWVSLQVLMKKRLLLWVLAGSLAGLCLAVKLTSLPMVIILLLAAWLHAFITLRQDSRQFLPKIVQFFVLPFFTLAAFLVFTLPTFARLPQIFMNLFLRHDTRPLFLSLAEIHQKLKVLEMAPYLLVLAILVVAVLVVYGLVLTWRLIAAIRRKETGRPAADISMAAFIIGSALALVYAIISIEGGIRYTQVWFDPGVFLRNTSPTFLVIPMAAAWLGRSLADMKSELWRKASTAAAVLGLLSLASAWVGYLQHRSDFVSYMRGSMMATQAVFERYAEPGKRIAVWKGSTGDFLDEASFHFWGNYAYARELFDDELLDAFSAYSYLKVREVNRLVSNEPEVVNNPEFLSTWKQTFSSPYYIPHNDELVTGEGKNIPLSALAFAQKDLEPEKVALEDLFGLVEERFGQYTLVEEDVGPITWVILLLSPGQ